MWVIGLGGDRGATQSMSHVQVLSASGTHPGGCCPLCKSALASWPGILFIDTFSNLPASIASYLHEDKLEILKWPCWKAFHSRALLKADLMFGSGVVLILKRLFSFKEKNEVLWAGENMSVPRCSPSWEGQSPA